MISRFRLGCGGCKPEKAEPKMWGVPVPPESQPMKPEAGSPSDESSGGVRTDR